MMKCFNSFQKKVAGYMHIIQMRPSKWLYLSIFTIRPQSWHSVWYSGCVYECICVSPHKGSSSESSIFPHIVVENMFAILRGQLFSWNQRIDHSTVTSIPSVLWDTRLSHTCCITGSDHWTIMSYWKSDPLTHRAANKHSRESLWYNVTFIRSCKSSYPKCFLYWY